MGSGAAEGAPADRRALRSLSHLDNSVPTRCQEPRGTELTGEPLGSVKGESFRLWNPVGLWITRSKGLKKLISVPPLFMCD